MRLKMEDAFNTAKNMVSGGYSEMNAIYFVVDSTERPSLALQLIRLFFGDCDGEDMTVEQLREWDDIDGNDGSFA